MAGYTDGAENALPGVAGDSDEGECPLSEPVDAEGEEEPYDLRDMILASTGASCVWINNLLA